MPKDLDSLRKSREIRKNVISKYGEVPTSVWTMKGVQNPEIITFGRTQQQVAKEKHKKMDYDKSLYSQFSASSQNVRGKQGGISVFPPELVARVVNYYSEPGDTMLDPFIGHNSRMQQTYLLGRSYIGYDICAEFMKFNRSVAKKIQGQNRLFKSAATIKLYEQSSEHLNEKTNSVDLVFTSPPYYRIEYYGPEEEQLGAKDSYDDFLESMQDIIRECFRVLKTGKFCVFNINDFRYQGKFYPYHADIIRIYENVGFQLHDIVIVKWAGSIGASFASQVEERKVTAKQHEYLIVGRKPLRV